MNNKNQGKQMKPVNKVTYIYADDADKMTSDELLAAIETANNNIKKLSAIGVDSKFVQAQIKEHQEALDLAVATLDKDFEKETSED